MRRRTAPRSTARRLAQTAVALLLAGAAVIAGAGPASAHDQLVSTSPADGATVSALPSAVTLTFSDVVVAGGADSNVVRVTDASCAQLGSGAVHVQDNVVTQKLTGVRATGPIHVVWRVVSQDGHPVSGDFTFTVGAPASPSPAVARCEGSAAQGPAATASPLPWIVGGGVLVLVIAGAGVLLAARSRRTHDQ